VTPVTPLEFLVMRGRRALLRSLDALHLASALSIAADLTAFIAYDRLLATAAEAAGLPTVQPGA